ncbi:MAG: hypothetical protein CL899_05365 [Dehalococcoidia bacterium]|jgi:hypothetical protein|nr:hypothetical protein [Dehalococcoidia bacterium]|tara:strand:- start:777 stop:965 length:189 start_codon:yes stop_codon:yes gene_type:complete
MQIQETEDNKCSLCWNEVEGFGYDPKPLTSGICCDLCNEELVIPHRIMISAQRGDQLKLFEM